MSQSNLTHYHSDNESQRTLGGTTTVRAGRLSKEIKGTTPEDVEMPEWKPPPNPVVEPTAFPEGGTSAWLTVAGSSACLFVSFGWVNCVGIFQEYYQTHQLRQYSASDIAWIPALQSR